MKTTIMSAETIAKLEAERNRRIDKRRRLNALTKTIPKPGDKYAKLTCIRVERGPSINNKPGKIGVICSCECGNEKEIKINTWRTGKAKSCGCSGIGPSAPKRKELIVVTAVDVSEAATAVAYMRLAQSAKWVIAA